MGALQGPTSLSGTEQPSEVAKPEYNTLEHVKDQQIHMYMKNWALKRERSSETDDESE